ncbi:hypothetical protein FGO68_gene12701 [Halteria grandinella]|uniref:Uncharacterized protein n=1 Tax=Halteria grandinella TaxID=5974 RepID=A0A8J8NCU9_HALGN|nr:hypothetical protein FGO68_gene12701 [Halteria grandinella]
MFTSISAIISPSPLFINSPFSIQFKSPACSASNGFSSMHSNPYTHFQSTQSPSSRSLASIPKISYRTNSPANAIYQSDLTSEEWTCSQYQCASLHLAPLTPCKLLLFLTLSCSTNSIHSFLQAS